MSVAVPEDRVRLMEGLFLFADLTRPQLQAIAHLFQEEVFTQGERILRDGFSGSNLYVIVEGQAVVTKRGTELTTLSRGDCFGEISVLLGEPPSADVVASTPLRCVSVAAHEVRDVLLAHPTVMFRMLQAEAQRLRNMNTWVS